MLTRRDDDDMGRCFVMMDLCVVHKVGPTTWNEHVCACDVAYLMVAVLSDLRTNQNASKVLKKYLLHFLRFFVSGTELVFASFCASPYLHL